MAKSSRSEIEQLVEDVSIASRQPAKSRTTNIKPVVAELTSSLYEHGVEPVVLQKLVELVTAPNHLDQASVAAILRNLYPTAKVANSVVLPVLACLGHGQTKASLNVQASLLRWMVLVYHVLETPAVLSRAYSVLFGLIDTAVIRNQVCHLLAIITRRRHVVPFRIQYLLSLTRQTGNDPSLVGLLRVFKDYYPEIIVGDAVRGKAAAFKHPDLEWRLHSDEIQELHRQRSQDTSAGIREGFRVHRPTGRLHTSRLLPTVHTSHAQMDSVTVEEVESAQQLVNVIDKLELPNQLVAALADPLLQKVILLIPSDASHRRIANWLGAALDDAMDGTLDNSGVWELLSVIRDFVSHVKVIPLDILRLLARFLQAWDGSGQPHVVLDILSHVSLEEFAVLHQQIFSPLESAVAAYGVAMQRSLVDMYTSILHSWTGQVKSLDQGRIPQHANQTISSLIGHASTHALIVLQASSSISAEASVLNLYEQMLELAMMETHGTELRIELPPAPLTYLLFFSSSLATSSRICHILASSKTGFETAMQIRSQDAERQRLSTPYSKAYVRLYNGYLMDACNCFWRSQAFSNSNGNAHRCLMSEAVVAKLAEYVQSVDRTFTLGALFTLSQSPMLALQSITKMRQLEDPELEGNGSIETRHAGPVSQASLARLATSGGIQLTWQEYRIRVLEHLDQQGFPGIPLLLKNTMTVLKRAMDGSGQSAQGTPSQLSVDMR